MARVDFLPGMSSKIRMISVSFVGFRHRGEAMPCRDVMAAEDFYATTSRDL
jgi:hypothetical protein